MSLTGLQRDLARTLEISGIPVTLETWLQVGFGVDSLEELEERSPESVGEIPEFLITKG